MQNLRAVFVVIALVVTQPSYAAKGAVGTVAYSGQTLANVDYHHGQLAPAIGTHNIQVMRANRTFPNYADGYGWTYNHAPNLSYWNNTFYVHYLSDPISEHVPPGKTFLVSSQDGYNWSMPQVLFPQYKIPDGTVKKGNPTVIVDLSATMHQRMGFYVAENKRLLAVGYYGISTHRKDHPNDGNGIGRAVREIKKDGRFGPIHFIRYNHKWNPTNTSFPFYKSSKDTGFVEACDELLNQPLMMQQWKEEADKDDPLVPMHKPYEALSFYHLDNGHVVGLWKYGFSAISKNNGRTWPEPKKAPGFVTKNAKMWGQKTSDGKFAIAYNPSEFRWPLAVSTSNDGLTYKNLWLVNGEIPPMRYGGNYKSYGPQYTRGIQEGNGNPPDNHMWLSYSMNKEDMWVAKIPVPISATATAQANSDFLKVASIHELSRWNIYSPKWAPVAIANKRGKASALVLTDKDRYDYAKVERPIPATKKLRAEVSITPKQNDSGLLHLEFQDAKGIAAVRIAFTADNIIQYKNGYRTPKAIAYEADKQYDIAVEMNVHKRSYNLTINKKKIKQGLPFFAPVQAIERVVFRTGGVRRFPNVDTPTDQDYDLRGGEAPIDEASFHIKKLVTKALD